MKISTKIQYGLRFLMSLSHSYGDEYIKLNEVARKQNIPEKYLENIVASIKAAGLIEVRRGAQGGYKLAKKPENISLRKVFEVLDGETLMFELSNATVLSDTPNFHVLQNFMSKFKINIDTYLERVSLEDLANQIRENSENQMFYI